MLPKVPSAARRRRGLHLLRQRRAAAGAASDCGKVSEGFAFPYGMCPHCGGKLAVLERGQRSTTPAALDADPHGLRDRAGRPGLLRAAAARVADPVLRELFGRFAAMENEHMETLSRRYHVTVPNPADGFQVDRAAVYAGIERPDRCSGHPVPHRHRLRAARRGLLHRTHARRTRRIRPSSSSTASWPPKKSSTWRCSKPSCSAGSRASRA